jgi:hypothetical protein
MFGFFKREKLPIQRTDAGSFLQLAFEDSSIAFQQACGAECLLHEGIILPALVLDARELFGAATAVEIQGNGHQIAFIRVASVDDGFIVSASTSGARGPTLQPGHFVAWQAERYDPQVAKDAPASQKRFGWIGSKDKRFGWVGSIKGTLKLEYKDGGWVGDELFVSERTTTTGRAVSSPPSSVSLVTAAMTR